MTRVRMWRRFWGRAGEEEGNGARLLQAIHLPSPQSSPDILETTKFNEGQDEYDPPDRGLKAN